jgi:hypothetical protein
MSRFFLGAAPAKPGNRGKNAHQIAPLRMVYLSIKLLSDFESGA